jgi:hypothetical protein
VKLVLQKLYIILLYYCVFYILLNTPFYRHRILMGVKEYEMIIHESKDYINVLHECYKNSKR